MVLPTHTLQQTDDAELGRTMEALTLGNGSLSWMTEADLVAKIEYFQFIRTSGHIPDLKFMVFADTKCNSTVCWRCIMNFGKTRYLFQKEYPLIPNPPQYEYKSEGDFKRLEQELVGFIYWYADKKGYEGIMARVFNFGTLVDPRFHLFFTNGLTNMREYVQEEAVAAFMKATAKGEAGDGAGSGVLPRAESTGSMKAGGSTKTEDGPTKTEDDPTKTEDSRTKTEDGSTKMEGDLTKTEGDREKIDDNGPTKTEGNREQIDDSGSTKTEGDHTKTDGDLTKTEGGREKIHDSGPTKTEGDLTKMEGNRGQIDDSGSTKTEGGHTKTDGDLTKTEGGHEKIDDSLQTRRVEQETIDPRWVKDFFRHMKSLEDEFAVRSQTTSADDSESAPRQSSEEEGKDAHPTVESESRSSTDDRVGDNSSSVDDKALTPTDCNQ